MDPERFIDPNLLEKAPTETSLTPPDPLQVNVQEFRNYWYKRLRGFGPGEDSEVPWEQMTAFYSRAKELAGDTDHTEAILRSMAPDVFRYNPTTMAIGLLEKIHRALIEKAIAERKTVSAEALVSYDDLKRNLAAKNEAKELESKIEEKLSDVIVENFDRVDAESRRNAEHFVDLFKQILAQEFPNTEIRIKRDDRVYTFELNGLTYTMVLPNHPIPRKYERAYTSPSFSQPVRINKSPAVIATPNRQEGEYLVIRKGEVDI